MTKLKDLLRKWMPEAAAGTEVPAVQEVPPKSTDMQETAEGPIDPSTLMDMFGDDENTLREIFQEFVEPAQNIVREINDAYEAKSAAGVGTAAHKLTSASRTIGANALADLCAELEAAGKSEDWEAIETNIPRLSGLMQAAIEYIKVY